jgi:hypothetical protein
MGTPDGFELVGHGPAATGGGLGWVMKRYLFGFRVGVIAKGGGDPEDR